MGNKSGTILLFDLKKKGEDWYILESGCGMNSDFSRYPGKEDLRAVTIRKLVESNPTIKVHLDTSALIGMGAIKVFKHIFGPLIREYNGRVCEFEDHSSAELNANDIIITLNPNSTAADYQAIEKTRAAKSPRVISMMGNETVHAVKENKVMQSHILRPTGLVKHPVRLFCDLSEKNLKSALDKLPFGKRGVLKPLDTGESRGCFCFEDNNELLKILSKIHAIQAQYKLIEMDEGKRCILRELIYECTKLNEAFHFTLLAGQSNSHCCYLYNPLVEKPISLKGFNDVEGLQPEKFPSDSEIMYRLQWGLNQEFAFSVNLSSKKAIEEVKDFLAVITNIGGIYSALKQEGYSASKIYSLIYWLFNDFSQYTPVVLQEYIKADSIEVDGEHYLPTYRAVFYAYKDQKGQQHFDVVDAYPKLPSCSLEINPSDLEAVAIANSKSSQQRVRISPAHLKDLKEAFKNGLRRSIFCDLLDVDLDAHFKKLLDSDKVPHEEKRYLSYYYEKSLPPFMKEQSIDVKRASSMDGSLARFPPLNTWVISKELSNICMRVSTNAEGNVYEALSKKTV